MLLIKDKTMQLYFGDLNLWSNCIPIITRRGLGSFRAICKFSQWVQDDLLLDSEEHLLA